MIQGKVTILDVSFWQDNDYTPYKIDFTKAWKRGADGVILREGQSFYLDEDYIDYAHNADLANLPRGAYWFYDSRSEPVDQANLFADLIKDTGFPPLGIWGDYEETYNGSYKGEDNFRKFMDRLVARFPNRVVGVYTGPDYWVNHTTSLGREYFKRFPLWIANYKVIQPIIPLPWETYLMWQYTSEGDGFSFGAESKEIDISKFFGTLEEYKQYFGLTNYMPYQGDDMSTVTYEGTISVDSAKVRLTAAGTDTGQRLLRSTPVQGTGVLETADLGGVTYQWVHVINPLDGWVATSNISDLHPVSPTPTTHKLEVVLDGEVVFSKEF